jgi:hypothetical protein
MAPLKGNRANSVLINIIAMKIRPANKVQCAIDIYTANDEKNGDESVRPDFA